MFLVDRGRSWAGVFKFSLTQPAQRDAIQPIVNLRLRGTEGSGEKQTTRLARLNGNLGLPLALFEPQPRCWAPPPPLSNMGRPYLNSVMRLRSVMISSGRPVFVLTCSTVAVRSRERKL